MSISGAFRGVKSVFVDTKESLLNELDSRIDQLRGYHQSGHTHRTNSKMEKCELRIQQIFIKLNEAIEEYEIGIGGSSIEYLEVLDEKLDALQHKFSIIKRLDSPGEQGPLESPLEKSMLRLSKQVIECTDRFKLAIDPGLIILRDVNKKIGKLGPQDLDKFLTFMRLHYKNQLLDDIDRVFGTEPCQKEIRTLRKEIDRFLKVMDQKQYPNDVKELMTLSRELKKMLPPAKPQAEPQAAQGPDGEEKE